MIGRLLLTVLVVYLGYHIFKGFFSSEPPKTEVKGSNKSRPIDLRQEDVEDAKFKDIEED